MKKHCGKEKVTKKLSGTIHDLSWAYPQVSDHLHFAGITPDQPITSLGFGTPHPSRPPSFALQRQIALLKDDRDADYYLFDDTDRPIRVELDEKCIKIAFRMLRSEIMFRPEKAPEGVEMIAELLMKMMADRPGSSRARILAQFEEEYGGNVAAKLAAFEAKRARNGYELGGTYLERMSEGMRAMQARGYPGLT